jgi:hypothetical protein
MENHHMAHAHQTSLACCHRRGDHRRRGDRRSRHDRHQHGGEGGRPVRYHALGQAASATTMTAAFNL